MKVRHGLAGAVLALVAVAVMVVAVAWGRELWLSRDAGTMGSVAASAPSVPVDPQVSERAGTGALSQVERGAYLVRIANCAGCHTARGQAPLAGGVGIATPFGTVRTSNLTPDRETGLGGWSADEFWRALHHGRSRDGRLLYPAFPYTSYTHLSRADADAIFAWLQRLPPVRHAVPAHELGWPYRSQTALAVWRLLYFRPGEGTAVGAEPAAPPLERGRYLVQAVGHCAECHAPRNRLGALQDAPLLRGGWVGTEGWVAPSLSDPKEAGLQHWSAAAASEWLRSGWSPQGAALGPMADVVAQSLQYLERTDAEAMGAYLRALPVSAEPVGEVVAAGEAQLALGRRVYAMHCADCHGVRGEGRRIDGVVAYPALAGNRAVTQRSAANVLQVLAGGAYPAATALHPRPFGMPPMKQALTAEEMAAVATLIRQSWGNEGAAVAEREVLRVR